MYTLKELYEQDYMKINDTLYVNAKQLCKWIDVVLYWQYGQNGTEYAFEEMVCKADVLKLIQRMAEDNILSDSKMQEIRNKNIKCLQKEAYNWCIEKHDYARVDKIIEGIMQGKITKDNLFDEVGKLTKGIASSHSVKRWEVLANLFFEKDWRI